MRRTATILGLTALLVAAAGPARAVEGPAPVLVGEAGTEVSVRDTDGTLTGYTPQQLGLEPSGAFALSVAQADLNADGFMDMVIGSPARVAVEGAPQGGRVDVVFGAAGGYGTGPATVTIVSKATEEEQFGGSLATFKLYRGTTVSELAVGAPAATVGGKIGAGAVYHYHFGTDAKATLVGRYTQNSKITGGFTSGVAGTAEKNDGFGSALAPGYGTVVVGVPYEDVGKKIDAGAINVLTFSTGGKLVAGASYSQNSKGVPGTAETRDRFGKHLAYGGYAVGVPGENVGKVREAGAVQTFRPVPEGGYGLKPGKVYTQDSPGIPGAVEAGDQFGSSLAYGWFGCADSPSIAAGTPREDLGDLTNSGTVTLIPFRDSDCPATLMHQKYQGVDGGIPGTAEKGEWTGETLAALYAPGTGKRADTLVIGNPSELVTGQPGAGRVFALFPSGPKLWASPVGDFAYGYRIASTVPDTYY